MCYFRNHQCEFRLGTQTESKNQAIKFIYYSAAEEMIFFLDQVVTDHGVPNGRIDHLPEYPTFAVQSLLSNAGYADSTGLTFLHGERQPLTQESPPHVHITNELTTRYQRS